MAASSNKIIPHSFNDFSEGLGLNLGLFFSTPAAFGYLGSASVSKIIAPGILSHQMRYCHR